MAGEIVGSQSKSVPGAAGETVAAGYQVLLYTGVDEEESFEEQKAYVKVPDLKGMTPLEAYDLLRKLKGML